MSKAIVLVAFGSAYLDGIKNSIMLLEEEFANEFNDEYLIITAFTSKKVISLLKERYNFFIPHITEALFNLANDGYDEVIIQPLHMIEGSGYNALKEIVNEYTYSFKKISLNDSLIYNDESINKLIDCLINSMEKGPILLAGHGLKNDSNEIYYKIKKSLSEKLDSNIYLATIEGDITIDNAIKEIKGDGIDEVTIKPLFIIPGKHIINDICTGSNSWKEKLEKEGIEVKLSKTSLLQYEEVRRMFINKVIISK